MDLFWPHLSLCFVLCVCSENPWILQLELKYIVKKGVVLDVQWIWLVYNVNWLILGRCVFFYYFLNKTKRTPIPYHLSCFFFIFLLLFLGPARNHRSGTLEISRMKVGE